MSYYSPYVGGSGPPFHWYSAAPWLAYQLGESAAPALPGERQRGADTALGGWTGTAIVAAAVGIGVVGYLIYRNVLVSEHAARGFGEALGGEEY